MRILGATKAIVLVTLVLLLGLLIQPTLSIGVFAQAPGGETPSPEPTTTPPPATNTPPPATNTPVQPTPQQPTPQPTPTTSGPAPAAPPPVIPEPVTVVLFGTGLAALSAAVAARRRKQD